MNEPTDLSVYKETLLFLVTAGVVAPLFFRLRISPVLGYLLAGVALGPYGLGRLAGQARWLGALAITNVEAIDRIAAFGVVALLFTMGLELSFERLRRMRALVFGLGLAQVVVTTLILTALASAAGLAPRSALTVGAALGDVLDRDRHPDAGREQAAPLGRRPGDLLRVALSGSGGRAAPRHDRRVVGWRRARPRLGAPHDPRPGRAGAGGAGDLRTPRVAAFLPFRRRNQSPEFFMAACLLVVLGDGLAAAASHLSMALGAFVAGLLLAETEYRREIELTIEPFRGLLLGLYFLSVGAGINPALIVARPGLILGLAATLIGIKGLTLFALGRGFRLPARGAAEMSLLLGPGGEFGFVMIGAAVAGGLVDRALATTLITAVALSMLIIPGLAKLGARVTRARAAGGRGEGPEIRRTAKSSRAIIVGYGRVGALIGDMLDRHAIPFIAVDVSAGARKPVRRQAGLLRRRGAARDLAPARARTGPRHGRHDGLARSRRRRLSRRRAACGRT